MTREQNILPYSRVKNEIIFTKNIPQNNFSIDCKAY